jgi:hypothetical protein
MLLVYIRIPKKTQFLFLAFTHILLSPFLDGHKSTYFTKLKKKTLTNGPHLIDSKNFYS